MALRIIRAFSFFSTDIETTCEYLETRSDKSIPSDSLVRSCKLYFEEQSVWKWGVKVPSKRGFAIGTKFNPPYYNLPMAGL